VGVALVAANREAVRVMFSSVCGPASRVGVCLSMCCGGLLMAAHVALAASEVRQRSVQHRNRLFPAEGERFDILVRYDPEPEGLDHPARLDRVDFDKGGLCLTRRDIADVRKQPDALRREPEPQSAPEVDQ